MAALPGTVAMAEGLYARGINLRDVLAYPSDREWPLFRGPEANPTDHEFQRLAAAGFTFVRVPVEPGPFLDQPEQRVGALMDRLVAVIGQARRAGLAVIVSPHPRPDRDDWSQRLILADRNGPLYRAYAAWLERLATTLSALGTEGIALGLMNEPQADCRNPQGIDWIEHQRDLYGRVRAVAAGLTVVLTTGCWSDIAGLASLDLAGYDPNVMIDVHSYRPFAFTHQGADWTLPGLRYMAGLAFPAVRTDRAVAEAASTRLLLALRAEDTPERTHDFAATLDLIDSYLREGADGTSIRLELAQAAEWADEAGLARERLIVGEFGALRPAPASGIGDDGSRERYLQAVSGAAQELGLGWALWEYHSSFGLAVEPEGKTLDPGMLSALGLRQVP